MANFMRDSVVKYACTCGILNPISKLFFCRHCLKLRCGFCVCHEVDSHFCSNCLENIPSTEARHKKNCCANCFDCPCCQHTLSARATTVVVKKNDDPPKEGEGDGIKVVHKKMYYLSCLACRWTSRDVGLPDQTVATGQWPDNECSYQTRFNSLLEYYQAVVWQEKQEKQEYFRRKAPKAHKYPSLTDRTGLTVSMIRRQIGWPEKSSQKTKPVHISPALATDDVGELPENIFTQKINLRNITTISQRHGQPADQPFTVNKLYPQRRFLWIKRSLRCRYCEHNVIKPEYHPTSVKYRIQLFANYHVPDVLLVRCENPLTAGETNSMILKFSNPTMHDMKITLEQLPNQMEETQLLNEFKKSCTLRDNLAIGLIGGPVVPELLRAAAVPTSLARPCLITEEPRLVNFQKTAQIEMLESPFVLNQRDDSKEFDDVVTQENEEPKFIVWRKANKASVRLNFTPNSNINHGMDVSTGFVMKYTYVNTVGNAGDKKEPAKQMLSTRVYVNLGTFEVNVVPE